MDQFKRLPMTRRVFDAASVEHVDNNDIILTIRNYGIVPWETPEDPSFDDWKGKTHTNYGFIRAITDKKGNVLAYTSASKIIPDPFPIKSRIGEWYAFEEFNINQIKDFEIAIPRWIDDKIGVRWSYDSKNHCYTLIMPNAFGCSEHWFITDGNYIISDYGNYDRTYKYAVKQMKPNQEIIKFVQQALQKKV